MCFPTVQVLRRRRRSEPRPSEEDAQLRRTLVLPSLTANIPQIVKPQTSDLQTRPKIAWLANTRLKPSGRQNLRISDPHQNLRLRVPYSFGIAMAASNATSVMSGNPKRKDSPLVRSRTEAPSIRNAARFVNILNAATAVENIQANEPYKRTTPG